MRVPSLIATSALLLSLALPTQAATVTTTVGRAADMYAITNYGCEDHVVGVTVRDGEVDLGAPVVATVEYFVNFSSFCEGGGGASTAFGGSVPLLPGDMVQTGTDSADFLKDISDGSGHTLHLALHWAGTGDVTVDPLTGKSSRAATVSGQFDVDGGNEISGSSLLGATLTVTQVTTTTPDCTDGKGHIKNWHKNGIERHHCGRDTQ